MPAIRKNITMPAEHWQAIDTARGDQPLSEWLREAAESQLPAKVRGKLPEAPGPGRPAKQQH